MEQKYQIIVLKPINNNERKDHHRGKELKAKANIIRKVTRNFRINRKNSLTEAKGKVQNCHLKKKIKIMRLKKVKVSTTDQEVNPSNNLLEDFKSNLKTRPTSILSRRKRSRNIKSLMKASTEHHGPIQKFPALQKVSTLPTKSRDEATETILMKKRCRNLSRIRNTSQSRLHLTQKTGLVEKSVKFMNQTPIQKSRNRSIGSIKGLLFQTSQVVDDYKKLLFNSKSFK
ncbi:unnamed protein product [Moneuplotes crassus]|uniref:Uncharacterized protein n=1 Tax=Euplotes crassus TaxID=5936 RepID=A0AAD1UQU9_EUPCR|nr:unnamed protein product [Moneuplotes crassus]